MRKVITVSAIALLSALTASSAFAAKTDTYKCEDQKIRVSFPDEDTAVMLYSDELIVLKSAPSASGARYVGENMQLWAQGKNEFNLASISEDDVVNKRVSDDKGRICKLVK
ncbi:MliC family protein [Providencia vermicola]|uniref:MliC family protein n=2 Tax=Providencia TaxID=586 RepID=A0AAI9I2S4_PROST|nr:MULTISPECIES: MliC family protein [Providencia]ELR5046294.1 MliC family protein [Providencia rettgeri]ELR5037411.1 MliC family protein [Providencia stuartii]ELR5120162.1 MliC family protein [Providencia stuartii]ELR5143551.1 MliC family protein [Providencia stuartii]ELR5292236.1 MliC family protein [Providencia stuartii]